VGVEASDAAYEAAWKARLDRRLPDGCKLDLSDYPAAGSAITVAVDPPEHSERVWRGSEVCPVCGLTTAGDDSRVGVTVDAGVMIGAWAHHECLGRCEVIGPAARIPW
jgi:hypothetical protein